MELTEEMRQAVELINNGTPLVYITGKAGTGKTTLLKYLIGQIKKQFVVAAPTGIAALNAGGMTLNSLFQIPFGIVTEKDAWNTKISTNRVELINSIDILVIDEVSMVNACIMDFINIRLQKCRKSLAPFGGVQVILFGDLYQLPPVITKDEMRAIQNYYDDVYFFNSKVVREVGLDVIALNKVFRQTNQEFVSMLNNIREYSVTNDDLDCLAETRDIIKSEQYNDSTIHICSFKKDAKRINTQMLGEPTHSYNGTTKGFFSASSKPAEELLELRVGARVMMLCNSQEFCNGSLGVVLELTDKFVKVQLDDGGNVWVSPNTWVEYEYLIDETKTLVKTEKGSYTQLPIALAWAITVHKSQGLTFNNITLHLSEVFASGQLYVALSRCRTLEGIVTDSFIGAKHVIPNLALVQFEKSYLNNNMRFNQEVYEKYCQ